MARQCQRQLLLGDAAAVIGDADQRLAAIGIGNLNPPTARINGVFHQFFHRRSGTFDHLTGSNSVDRSIIQLPNNRQGGSVFGAYIGVIHRHKTKSSMFPFDSTTKIAVPLRRFFPTRCRSFSGQGLTATP